MYNYGSMSFKCARVQQKHGGVDLMDALVALYRIHARSKKFYYNIFYHILDVTVVNCWLLYRRDCQSLEIPRKNVMMLQEFKFEIAECLLMEEKKPSSKKRGRSSVGESVLFQFDKKQKISPATKAIPSAEVRTDGFNHFPIVVSRTPQKPGMQSCPCLLLSKMQSAFVHHKR